jgi:hypothetical protein
MNGYWNTLLPDNDGRLVIELDERANRHVGKVYFYPSTPNYPPLVGALDLPIAPGTIDFSVSLFPMDSIGLPILDKAVQAERFPNWTLPGALPVRCERADSGLTLTWTTATGKEHRFEVPRNGADQPSTLKVLPIHSWNDFKAHIAERRHYQFVFRGQNSPWKLRTPFHRTGRADLAHFFDSDIPILHRALSGSTRIPFNPDDARHNAAFLSMIQHHGYPTPLLDWTYSPFVAAYFAYKARLHELGSSTDLVRVLIFDKHGWCNQIQQIFSTDHRWPHFTIVEPLALNNPRLIPQQALSSYTTVDDIEAYIAQREAALPFERTPFLEAIDLPANEGPIVMRDLTRMGITAASLFPGLDGICEEMRLRNFVYAKD